MADEETPKMSRSIIMQVREQVHLVRDRYHSEVSNGEVTDPTRRQLARVVLTYHGSLREFRDHAAVKDLWNDETSVVSEIARLRSGTATIWHDIPGASPGKRKETVPAIRDVSPGRLVEMTHDLDDVANELGFAETPKQTTPSDDAGMKDLRGLLKARGQSEALENLPSGSEQSGEVAD